MENLHRVIAAYKAMDQRHREEILRFMEKMASMHPAPRRLVLATCLGRVQDKFQTLRKGE